MNKPLEAAIEWMVLLRSGEAAPDDWERLRVWCAADPRHARAWEQVSGALRASVEPLRRARADSAAQGEALQAALLRPRRRRAVGGVLGLLGMAAGAGWLLQHQGALQVLVADLRTGTGERRSLTLADGSQLLLNAGSALDIEFSPQERLLRLREGAVIVSVAPDAARPFVVATAEGRVRALGTRFLVRQDSGRSLVAVLEHSVRVRTRAGAERVLYQDEALWFDAEGIGAPVAAQKSGFAAWEHGMLAANDLPLGEVIDALRPYRSGLIRVSPAAAELRVLGAFSLQDPDFVLQSLAETLPIRVNRYGSWLVSVTRKPEP